LKETPKVIVLCTLSTGLDSISEVIRKGFDISCIVGLNPKNASPVKISGYIDIEDYATKNNLNYIYVNDYSLKDENDKYKIIKEEFDIIWVAGWQRLIPEWLINMSTMGAIGVHGSPDGIEKGRGRSPQNWSILLGCNSFNISLFRLTPGVDNGSIINQRDFKYLEGDDIKISYYRVSIVVADMICELLEDLSLLDKAKKQSTNAYYYPQRLPKDGYVDWNLQSNVISRHCRSMTKPYPGIRTIVDKEDIEIIMWEIIPFDNCIQGEIGQISNCFYTNEFLVNCCNGRVLIRDWDASDKDWKPKFNTLLLSKNFSEQIENIINRHDKKYNKSQPISPRILNALNKNIYN
tara:strand:- start:4004 stop:5050 length:1047 start_codon:yes stop_codon:yes gene_type:complete